MLGTPTRSLTEGSDDSNEITGSGDEEQDEAAKIRRKLGLPEFDPDATMVSSIPKIMLLR